MESAFSKLVKTLEQGVSVTCDDRKVFAKRVYQVICLLPRKGKKYFDPHFVDSDIFFSLITKAGLNGPLLSSIAGKGSNFIPDAVGIIERLVPFLPIKDRLSEISDPSNKVKAAYAETIWFQRANRIFMAPTSGSLHKYFPTYLGPQDAQSKMILALKNSQQYAIEYYSKRLNELLSKDAFVICVVPPSKASNSPDSGIHSIARNLCKNGLRLDGTNVLLRRLSVSKKSFGGSRDLRIDLNSIVVSDPGLLKGRRVLLLDDVTTTGDSLKACKQLLELHAPVEVLTFALAKTSH